MSRVRDRDRGWDRLSKEIAAAAGMSVAVGYIADRGGGSTHSGGVTNAQLAAIHEFGAPGAGIPERSFIRSTFDRKSGEWTKLAEKLAQSVYDGRRGAGDALELLGLRAVADVKNSVTSGPGIPPPLKPATIARKGSARPLIDKGRLITSLTHAVRKGSQQDG